MCAHRILRYPVYYKLSCCDVLLVFRHYSYFSLIYEVVQNRFRGLPQVDLVWQDCFIMGKIGNLQFQEN